MTTRTTPAPKPTDGTPFGEDWTVAKLKVIWACSDNSVLRKLKRYRDLYGSEPWIKPGPRRGREGLRINANILVDCIASLGRPPGELTDRVEDVEGDVAALMKQVRELRTRCEAQELELRAMRVEFQRKSAAWFARGEKR